MYVCMTYVYVPTYLNKDLRTYFIIGLAFIPITHPVRRGRTQGPLGPKDLSSLISGSFAFFDLLDSKLWQLHEGVPKSSRH